MNYDTNKILKISMGGRWMRYPLSRWLKGLADMIHHIQHTETKDMVEIGCFSGESTEIFVQYFKSVYAVDIWNKNYFSEADANIEEIFDTRMKQFKNMDKMKMKSSEAVTWFKDKSLDFVYIDGSHWYDDVKQDINLWLPKVKPHSFIGGHDFWITNEDKEHRGVVQAVCEQFGYPDKTFDDFSWIVETHEEMYDT